MSCGAYQHQVLIPFRVRVPRQLLEPAVKCYVVGSCQQLGNWNLEKALSMQQMQQQDCEQALLGRDVQIPLRVTDVSYRFFLARCHNPNDEDSEVTLCISYWESHKVPRQFNLMDCLTEKVRPDLSVPQFGQLDGRECIERGWLTGQTQVHLHLQPGCIEWYRSSYKKRMTDLLVGCYAYSVDDDTTPEYSNYGNRVCNSHASGGIQLGDLEDSLSGFDAVVKHQAMVCALKDGQCRLRQQSADGELRGSDDYIVFQVDTFDLESTAFHFDFTDPANKNVVGSAKLMPLKSLDYKGVKILQIVSSKQASPLLGTLKVNYLIISSIAPHLRNDMSRTHRKHWKKRKTMDVGHRGAGNSRNKTINSVRENTIHSMNLAAEHGADFVEIDVQFSKDKVPVVFHDFNVAVTMRLKQKKLRQIDVPVKNFTVESLQSMKLCTVSEMTDNEEHLETEDVDPVELQPFPSLQQCLEQVHSNTGFLVEVKYPQKVKGSSLEENLEYYAERNFYVNRILTDVIEHGGDRRIVLCSFDADCCTMLQLKQNRYPVLFLTQGRSESYPPYEDIRCNSTLDSMYHALSLDILGLSANVEEVAKNESLVQQVQASGLVLFLWGEGLNNPQVKRRFRELGVDAIIYDYIHTVKEHGSLSVFMQEVVENSDKSRSSSTSPSRSASVAPPENVSQVSSVVNPTG